MINDEALRQGVDPKLAKAIAFGGEMTNGDPLAKSPKGAQGIFQLMPATAAEMGVTDSMDVQQNIRGGVGYIKKLNSLYPGDISRIAAAYNAGPGAVDRHGGIPPYKETQAYVPRVLAAYQAEGRLGLPTTAQSTGFPTGNLTPGLQQQIAARDPRQGVIDLGLKIMGKQRSDFGGQFDQPGFVDNFYRATMAHAEANNPNLNLASSSMSDYTGTLTKLATEAETKRKQPTATTAPAAPKKDESPGTTSSLIDIPVQMVHGVVDAAGNVLNTASDIADFATKKLYDLGVLPDAIVRKDANGNIAHTYRPGETLKDVAADILGQPKGLVSGVAKGLAEVLVPFIGIDKALKAAQVGGKTAAVTAGLVTNTAFIDPDSPTITEMVGKFATTVSPEDPESLRSAISRYIAHGDPAQLDTARRLTGRMMHGVEGLLIDGAFKVFEMLRASKAAKGQVLEEVASTPTNPTVLPKAAAANEAEIVAKEVPGVNPSVGGTKPGTTAKQLAEESKIAKAASPVVEEVTPVVEKAAPVADITATVAPELPASAKPGFTNMWTPAKTKQVSETVDTVVENTARVAKGEPPTTIQLVDHMPEATSQEALQAAEQMLSDSAEAANGKVVGKLDKLMDTLKTTISDPTNQKIALAIMLKGTVGGLITNQLIDPFEASAADAAGDSHDAKVRELKNFLIGAGLAVGGAAALKMARKLRASAGEAIDATGLKLAASTRLAGPEMKFVKTATEAEAGLPQTVTTVGGKRYNIKLDHVRDAADYQDLVEQTRKILPDEAAAVDAMLGTSIDDTMAVARKTGMSPAMVEVLKRTNTPKQYSNDIATTLVIADASQRTVANLRDRILAGEAGLGDEFLRQVALMAEAGRGLMRARSDIGRAMNVLRQAADGRIELYQNAGAAIGSYLKSDMDIEKLALRFAGMDPGEMAATAREMVRPTRKGAIAEAILSGWLAQPVGAVKQAASDVSRIFLEMIGREFGAIEGAAWKVMGYEIPAGTPYMREPLVMMQSLINNTWGSLKAGYKAFVTGEHVWANHATTTRNGTSIHTPQFTSEAFGWENNLLEKAGVNAAYKATMDKLGLPNTGNVIDAMGNWIRFAGTRLRLSADETTQYLIHQVELDSYATRAALDEGLSGAEKATFISQFKASPPDNILEQIQREKQTWTYMNSLMDERGGFQKLRQVVGSFNAAVNESALARVQFPFLRSHMNLLTTTMEYTPGLNLASSSFRAELQSSDPIVRAAAQGKLWTGMFFTLVGAGLGAAGVVTGPLSTNPALTEELKRAGKEPNSLHIGNTALPLNPDEPLGFLLRLTSQIGAAASGDATPEELNAATSAIVVASELLTHAPIVQALGKMFDAMDSKRIEGKDKKSGTGEAVLGSVDDAFLKPFLPPSIFQQLAKIIEPHRQVADSWAQTVANRTPGLGSGQVETDIMGRPRFVGGGVDGSQLNNFVQMFFPASILPKIEDPLDKAMVSKGVVVKDPRASYSVGPIDVPLEKSEVQQLKLFMADPGQGAPRLYDALKDLTEKDFWKTATPGKDGTAQLAVDHLISRYSQAARTRLYNESQSLRERILAKGQQSGMIQPTQ